MDSPSRPDFFAGLQPGGKYDGIVGIYRNNTSADFIGIFDKDLVSHLPSSVKWIAHNGAGYDQIDVRACKGRGTSQPSRSQGPRSDQSLVSSSRVFEDMRVQRGPQPLSEC